MAGWKRFFQNLGMNAARTAAEESPVSGVIDAVAGNAPAKSYEECPVCHSRLEVTFTVSHRNMTPPKGKTARSARKGA